MDLGGHSSAHNSALPKIQERLGFDSASGYVTLVGGFRLPATEAMQAHLSNTGIGQDAVESTPVWTKKVRISKQRMLQPAIISHCSHQDCAP